MNLAQKYGKLYFFSKIKVYVTLSEEKHVYMPCVTIRACTYKKILFLKNLEEVKGIIVWK